MKKQTAAIHKALCRSLEILVQATAGETPEREAKRFEILAEARKAIEEYESAKK